MQCSVQLVLYFCVLSFSVLPVLSHSSAVEVNVLQGQPVNLSFVTSGPAVPALMPDDITWLLPSGSILNGADVAFSSDRQQAIISRADLLVHMGAFVANITNEAGSRTLSFTVNVTCEFVTIVLDGSPLLFSLCVRR